MEISENRETDRGSNDRSALLDWLPAAGVAVITLVFGMAAIYAPPAKGEMAIMFSPGTTESTAYSAIVKAGGRIVSTSRFENVVIAYALDEGFKTRVRKQGGWFAFAATGLCAPANLTST